MPSKSDKNTQDQKGKTWNSDLDEGDNDKSRANAFFFLGLDSTPLYFDQIIASNVLLTPFTLTQDILAHYTADAVLRSPAYLGSLQVLGAPTMWIGKLRDGFKDLLDYTGLYFYRNYDDQSSSSSSLRLFSRYTRAMTGASIGFLSLLGHVAIGTLQSLTGLSVSISRNLDILLQNSLFAESQKELNNEFVEEEIPFSNISVADSSKIKKLKNQYQKRDMKRKDLINYVDEFEHCRTK